VKDFNFIKKILSKNDFLICVDGGLNLCKKLHLKIDLFVGDMDSKKSPLPKINTLILNKEKNETDTMVAARQGLLKGFNDFLILGGTGARLDHLYANLCTLKFLTKNKVRASLLDEHNEILILPKGSKISIKKTTKYFSIFPFGCNFCQLSGHGFKYKLNGTKIFSHATNGISNEILDKQAKLFVENGTALIFSSNDSQGG
jgi:thiamine pyrophosphokinase